jgi:hypothetical protein
MAACALPSAAPPLRRSRGRAAGHRPGVEHDADDAEVRAGELGRGLRCGGSVDEVHEGPMRHEREDVTILEHEHAERREPLGDGGPNAGDGDVEDDARLAEREGATPMCSIYREPRWEECTICTAAAPEDVFTVRRYGETKATIRPAWCADPPLASNELAGYRNPATKIKPRIWPKSGLDAGKKSHDDVSAGRGTSLVH